MVFTAKAPCAPTEYRGGSSTVTMPNRHGRLRPDLAEYAEELDAAVPMVRAELTCGPEVDARERMEETCVGNRDRRWERPSLGRVFSLDSGARCCSWGRSCRHVPKAVLAVSVKPPGPSQDAWKSCAASP